jgi:hypothetical protein
MRNDDSKNVAKTVAEVLNTVGYDCDTRLRPSKQNGPIYGVGGCDCGCSPDFQMYYSEDKLAIIPIVGRNPNFSIQKEPPIVRFEGKEEVRAKIISNLREILPKLKTLDVVFDGDECPEYLQSFRRKQQSKITEDS